MSIKPNKAVHDVCEELHRQEGLGYTPAHDDEHQWELAGAGAAYACAAADQLHPYSLGDGNFKETPPDCWPDGWEWKHKTARENLVRAAALCIAQIKQIDRTAL